MAPRGPRHRPRLKIPVSGVQFSPCPPFFWSAKRRNPALGLAIRHVGSHEPRGMPCDPLGPFLIADWVPVWVPVFGAIRPIFVTVGGRAAARHRRLRARDVLLEPATSHGRPDYAPRPLDLGELTGSAPPAFTLPSAPPPEPFGDGTAQRSSDGVAGRGAYEHRRQSCATQADSAGDCCSRNGPTSERTFLDQHDPGHDSGRRVTD
jgi:hypothetical protein